MIQLALGRRAALVLGAGGLAWPAVGRAQSEPVRIGAILSASGGLAAFTPPIRAGIGLALEEVNAAGGLLGGRRLQLVEADDQTNPQVAVSVATRLVQADNVSAIIGPMASGITIAVANAVTVPAGVPIISPSATAPAVSQIQDNDTVFRTAVPDDLQGQVLARVVRERGIERAAVMAINNDYGRGLANAFSTSFQARGGTVTASQNFEENRPSYRAELQTLAGRGGPQALVLIAYPASGGNTILRNAIENAFFTRFVLTDGMRDQSVVEAVGARPLAGSIGTAPGSAATPEQRAKYEAAFRRANPNLDPGGAFVAQAYDAAYVIALAIQRAGSAERAAIRAAIREVANAPGEVVGPGEFARARDLLARGAAINYEGASGPIEFNQHGDAQGRIEVWEIQDGRIVTIANVSE
ncbi:branched-chain amino acid ABC transporter substrate-binding protein [Caldovatus sediminis]|uniref:Branched-chain amino acid ABC transporter substrate-binding protein n=1 Tax=Caldovatus sediminis TaxID=2041189 RepID=A0A8J2ZC49_9PROT|nr:ABC transporter substrate-binding protein [Caldovatus sediminis]GGG35930.1 branched-chain amino acid ABC transporter substrate-binding protein [Caldovatus sediminis]